jgi:hypothetical protein
MIPRQILEGPLDTLLGRERLECAVAMLDCMGARRFLVVRDRADQLIHTRRVDHIRDCTHGLARLFLEALS